MDETKALSVWIQKVKELRLAVSGCSLVKQEPLEMDAGVDHFVAPNSAMKAADVKRLVANVALTVDWLNDGLELKPELATCGEVNASYYPATHELVICRELASEPDGVQRFIVAHEMAHAYIDQRDIPYTGSQEAAADELAAVLLIVSGHQMDVLDAGYWLSQHPTAEDVRDVHQDNAKRAWTLMCLEDGSEDQPMVAECAAEFHRAARSWARLLFNDR